MKTKQTLDETFQLKKKWRDISRERKRGQSSKTRKKASKNITLEKLSDEEDEKQEEERRWRKKEEEKNKKRNHIADDPWAPIRRAKRERQRRDPLLNLWGSAGVEGAGAYRRGAGRPDA